MAGWTELFRGKSSIYALDEMSKEWTERGITGQLIMFQNNQFRQDIRIKWMKSQREVWWRLMNGKLKPKGPRAWVLKAWDTSSNKQEILAIRFSDNTLSQQFSAKFSEVFPPQDEQPAVAPPPNPVQLQQQHQQQQYGGFQPNYPQNQMMGINNPMMGMNGQMMGMNNPMMGMNPMGMMGMGGMQSQYGMYGGANFGQQPQPQPQQQQARNWECAVCTYSNDINRASCIMCGLSKDSALKADNKANRKATMDAIRQPQIPTSPHMGPSNQYNYPAPNEFNFQENALKQMQQQSGSQARILRQFDRHLEDAAAVTSPHIKKESSWICPMCTLHNSISVTRCDACNASRNNKRGSGNAGGLPAPPEADQPPQPKPPQAQPQPFNMYNNGGNNNPLMGGNNGMMMGGFNNPMGNSVYGGFGGGMNGGMMGMNGMGGFGGNNAMMGIGMHNFAPSNTAPTNAMAAISERFSEMKANGQKKAATVQEFTNTASDIACYNDNPSQVFSTLRSVAKKLLKDDVRYRTLDTTNPKVMERLIGFEGVLDFLMLLGFESDAIGMKLICEQKPSPQIVRNAIEVLNTYEGRLGLGRKKKRKNRADSDDQNKQDDEQSYITAGGPAEDLEAGLTTGGAGSGGADKDEEDTLTLEQVVIWSTHENMRDNDTMDTLILTHKQFTNSLTLIRNLRRRFDVPIPNDIRNDENKINEFRLNVQKRIQLKVIKSLRDWMKTYWDEDFLNDLEVQKELMEWLRELDELKVTKSKECPWIAPLASMVTKEFERFKLKSPNQMRKEEREMFLVDRDTGVPRFLATVSLKKAPKLSNVTAEDLAEQITLMDYRVFSSIAERECIGQAWKKKKECSPNVLAMIQQFNSLTVFVQLQILQEKSLSQRSKAIKRIIKMGERFRDLKNYNALCAILGALNSSPIHRLKLAWQKVPEKQLGLFEAFKQIFVNTRNFRNYRTLFRNLSPPAIPYFGLFLQDLVFIDDGNDQFKQIDNFAQHGLMVNFNKSVRTMDRIKNIRLYQTNSYKDVIKSQEMMQKILYQEFHKMRDWTEDDIWNMSTEVKKQDEGKKN